MTYPDIVKLLVTMDLRFALKIALAGWLVSAMTVRAVGQTGTGGAYEEFTLRYALAADIEPVLKNVLSGLPERADVRADGQTNRLLVQGSTGARRLARQTIQSLDRPAADNLQQPILKAYASGAEDLEELAARIQGDFPAGGGTRVSVDHRTSQVLVLAAPRTHALIARRIGRAVPPAAEANQLRGAGTHRQVAHEPTRALRLEHKTWPQIHALLEKLWGKPLVSTKSPDSARVNYRLNLPSGVTVGVSVDEAGKDVVVAGQPAPVGAVARLIAAFDSQGVPGGRRTQVVPVRNSSPESVRRVIRAFQYQAEGEEPSAAGAPQTAKVIDGSRSGIRPLARLFQNPPRATRIAQVQPQQPNQPQPGAQPPGLAAQFTGLLGDVQVIYIEALDTLILIGTEQDVALLMQIIEDLEKIPQPVIEVYQLKHVGSEALQEVVGELYVNVLAARQGPVSITALVKPNALLLIGRAESVEAVKTLVNQLDQPVDESTQFEVIKLTHASAADVVALIEGFYDERPGLGPRVIVTSDFNTNSVIVQASPRDLVEVKGLIQGIDTGESNRVNEVQIFPLQNTLSTDIAPILLEAIYGQGGGRRTGTQQGGGGQFQGPQQAPGQGAQGGGQRTGQQSQTSSRLEFLTVDENQQQQRLQSGIITNVTITAEPRQNVLIVSAPADSMDLLAALIRQLDQPPSAVAQVKVFTLKEGDSESLAVLLQELFGQQAAGGQAGQPLIIGEGDASLVPLRFSTDARTNSIIATGSESDLAIVEAILFRLDEGEIRHRQTTVYRLKNAPAEDVSITINAWLQSEQQVQQISGLQTPFEQIEREVVVVPEVVSNSLIISATPRFYAEVLQIIKDIDEPPPMVLIKVLIAEVVLNDTDEFGVELGLQDSVLFDRSLLGDLITTQSSTSASTAEGVITTTQDVIQAATLTPGFVFNNQPLGNAGSAQALAGSNHLAGQALSHFSVGRVNGELGYGGLVLSASNESVNILIRALQETRRLDVLSAPQIMTLDNQQARVQIGQRVPRISGVTFDDVGRQTNNIVQEDVGLILLVQPRVTPDGMVVMAIAAEKSEVGPEAEGIPISISLTGEVIRSPRINTVTVDTVVNVRDGQTVVLGGLFTTRKTQTHRRVPLLSSIPVLGHLFRFDSVGQQKTELLIFMTPYVIRTSEDAEILKQIEASRMSWCLADVHKVYGDIGFRGPGEEWSDDNTIVVYPDLDPTGEMALPLTGEGAPANELPRQLPPGTLPEMPGPQRPAIPPPAGPELGAAGYHPAGRIPVQPVMYQGPPPGNYLPQGPPHAGRLPN